MAQPAVFLDRDGTLIEDTGFIARADQVRLVPGAAGAVARFRESGFLVIVVTNQSGIARGFFDWDAYRQVAARIDRLLEAEGTRLDGTYVCPHHPEITGPCECRKPGSLLYLEAARDHDVDLARSVWIGDRRRDVEASVRFGGRGILVGKVEPAGAPFPQVADLAAAADLVTDR